MISQFNQPRGSTSIEVNKQSIARNFGVKEDEVVYFTAGIDLSGFKVIYDESTQRAYSLPSGIVSGTTAISLNEQAILVHSAGTVDLGELAATRREFVNLSDSFDAGLVVNTRNELLFHNGIGYTYLGALPVTITEGTNPVGNADWKPQTDPDLREELSTYGIGTGSQMVDGLAVESLNLTSPQTNITPLGRHALGKNASGLDMMYRVVESAEASTDGTVVIDRTDGNKLVLNIVDSIDVRFLLTVRELISK